MKSRDSLIRLRRFEVDEKKQKVVDLESMIDEFRRMAGDLDRQIEVEQQKAGVSDINHYAYPTFAKAAMQRRDNLMASLKDLEAKLEEARSELADSFEDLKKVELLEERGATRDRFAREKSEQQELEHFVAARQPDNH
ncbi:MAG: flagellar export protein FliJ [Methyloligellaceae bacterium]